MTICANAQYSQSALWTEYAFIEADLFAQYPPMLLCRLPMDLVAAQARRFRSVHYHVAHVSRHVAAASIQTLIIRQREIRLEIAEQVVAGDELIRIP